MRMMTHAAWLHCIVSRKISFPIRSVIIASRRAMSLPPGPNDAGGLPDVPGRLPDEKVVDNKSCYKSHLKYV